MKIALSEEREQQQEALNKTNKLAQEEMLRFCAEQRKVSSWMYIRGGRKIDQLGHTDILYPIHGLEHI